MPAFFLAIFRKARALLTTYYAYMLEYRAELWFWVLSNSLPIVMLGVWTQAATSGRFPLDAQHFARYFLSVFIVRQLTIVWVIWEFEREVVQGRLSFRLLQPLDPFWVYISSHIAERFARLPFWLALIVLFCWLYPQAAWWPGTLKVLGFLGIVALAFTLRFLLQYTLAMLAFWTERASALQDFFFLFYLFLSGGLAPLEVYPPLVRAIAHWTPFPYVLHLPAAYLIGLPVDLVRGIGAMIAWCALLLILNRWLWRRGLRHYSGMGA
ncbi:ABC-type uncharacterized transport system, permease component [Rubidibacter lacunae KORDI 51-2]|uniref:ABC-type uncharacterized transport system, permease component n=1 Tax=Rubidibacter lacunae KORDI 51-2 TaxID=582515 RepID=U5DJJ6_9CHRO|nr:ABC-2 family transporter protein [Rubidibacter lacunae]ERN41866.1 ABC-type uncharacterized transport system, permease component [Rubidibacter lacunae KORDI 51-2]